MLLSKDGSSETVLEEEVSERAHQFARSVFKAMIAMGFNPIEMTGAIADILTMVNVVFAPSLEATVENVNNLAVDINKTVGENWPTREEFERDIVNEMNNQSLVGMALTAAIKQAVSGWPAPKEEPKDTKH